MNVSIRPSPFLRHRASRRFCGRRARAARRHHDTQCDPLFRQGGEQVRSIEPINLTVFRSPRCDQVGILKLDSTSVQFGVFILFTRIPSVAELVASADGSVDTDMMNFRLK